MFLTADDIRALQLELNVSEQCATGNGGALIVQYAKGITGKFKYEELGLGWGESPSILQTARGARAANVARRDRELKAANAKIKELIADAKQQGKRTYAKPLAAARGCSGCSSCVPDVRLRPFRASKGQRLGAWIPRAGGSFEQASAMRVARATRKAEIERDCAARIQRQFERAERKKARELEETERKSRHTGARTQQQKRRAEARAMSAAAVRILES